MAQKKSITRQMLNKKSTSDTADQAQISDTEPKTGENRLHINCAGLDLDLRGSSEELRRAYQALRPQLVERFYATMLGPRRQDHRTLELPTISRASGERPSGGRTSGERTSKDSNRAPARPRVASRPTPSLPASGGQSRGNQPGINQSQEKSAGPGQSEALSRDEDSVYVNLVVCEAAFRKMYLLDKPRFEAGFLSETLKIEPLHRIYISSTIEQKVRAPLQIGSTLWRELTAAGRAVFDGSD